MNGNVVVLTIPIFFALVAFEFWYQGRKGVNVGTFRTAASNILCGLLERLFLIFTFGFLFWSYSSLSSWVIPVLPWRFDASSPWTYVIGLVVSDFCYYWLHRVHHSVGFLWAAHVVHHQPQEMNFTVGLRTAPIQTLLFSAPFYVPAILVGIPALPFFVANGLMNSLQLLVHTELNWNPQGRFRFLALIFNTPSHHCVHHGSQDQYLDKNFGAVFIIWDRLFGTFVPQGEKVVYGARRPLPTLNPIRALFDEYRFLFQAGRLLKAPLGVWFWSPAKTASRLSQLSHFNGKIDFTQSAANPRWRLRKRETFFSLAVTFSAFFTLLYQEPKPPAFVLFLWASHIVLGIFIAGEWLDHSVRARALERWRSMLLLTTGFILFYLEPNANRWPVFMILLAASVCAYISLPRRVQDFEAVSVS
ncbi:MAG: sterol desaturase family protein [Bdellovibrionales bacterium]|nr:sterol desaturase family protein [Bdellovibrionales bacterium]